MFWVFQKILIAIRNRKATDFTEPFRMATSAVSYIRRLAARALSRVERKREEQANN